MFINFYIQSHVIPSFHSSTYAIFSINQMFNLQFTFIISGTRCVKGVRGSVAGISYGFIVIYREVFLAFHPQASLEKNLCV